MRERESRKRPGNFWYRSFLFKLLSSANEVAGSKVMFSQVSVILSTGEGGWVSMVPCLFGGVCVRVGMYGSMSRGRVSPNPLDLGYNGMRSASGQYASYWNASMF